MKKAKKGKTVVVSGGFDPVHAGHVRMFEAAKKAAGKNGKLIVVLNGDDWLKRKKGYVFMPSKERAEVIGALRSVDKVEVYNSKTRDDVSVPLSRIKPDIFANGGDRKARKDIPEAEVCEKYGIKMVFNIGGGKVQSSSWLVDEVLQALAKLRTVNENDLEKIDYRPWGHFINLITGNRWHTKVIHVKPKSRLSLQSHRMREEMWVLLEGEAFAHYADGKAIQRKEMTIGRPVMVSRGQVHRIEGGVSPAKILEVSLGGFDEGDIVRVEDDHGRN